ncbi:hypothetical protein L9F63_021419, partial [Diploptera punctata]
NRHLIVWFHVYDRLGTNTPAQCLNEEYYITIISITFMIRKERNMLKLSQKKGGHNISEATKSQSVTGLQRDI